MIATVHACFAGPFNFLDTAASYGDGESEHRLGIVLRELGGLPSGFVLAMKADRAMQTGIFTDAQMRRSVERSLRLLGLEHLQLVYLHDPEHISFAEAMQPGGPVAVLQQCKISGIITEADHKGWQPANLAPFINVALEAFGEERVLSAVTGPLPCSLLRTAAGTRHWQRLPPTCRSQSGTNYGLRMQAASIA